MSIGKLSLRALGGALFLSVALTLPAAAQIGEVPAEARFGIHGSRTLGTNLIPNLFKGYAAKIGATYEIYDDNPKERIIRLIAADGSVIVEVDLQTKGSGSAFPGIAEGIADIGTADRRMNDKDLEKLVAVGLADLRNTSDEVVIGLDGIVTLVHPSNPLESVAFEELSRIFSGEATNWKEFGGPDAPIVLHSFPDGSGDRSIFLARAVEPFGKTESEAAIEHEEYADLRDAVAADPNAIGFLGRAFVGQGVKVLPIRETCGILSEPTDFRMKTEGYAMSRRIYFYRAPGGIHPMAQDLIYYAFTPEGQDIIAASGFVDRELDGVTLEDMAAELEIARSLPDFDGESYQAMTTDLAGALRLSTAFRFAFGKTSLDPLSERAITEFAAAVNAGGFADKEILVVGFADSVGSSNQNDRIAAGRAETVRQRIAAELDADILASSRLTAVSYGESLPVLCNDDEAGREANRRVEIWIR